jgi:hypothetical protein
MIMKSVIAVCFLTACACGAPCHNAPSFDCTPVKHEYIIENLTNKCRVVYVKIRRTYQSPEELLKIPVQARRSTKLTQWVFVSVENESDCQG